MALQVVSPAINVYRVTGVKDGQEQVEEQTFRRGDILPSWVSTSQQFVLTQTGMARQVGDFPDPALVAASEEPAPVILPEHIPQAVVGSEVTGPAVVTGTAPAADAGAGAEPAADVQPLADMPKESDTKPVWEDAAVSLGMKRGEAEGMRKADLMAEVNRRQEAALAAHPREDA